MKRLDLILNGKGGVGKSFFAVNFVQFLKDKGVAHVAIDSDNENSTLKRFHPNAQFLDLDKRRELDSIFGALEKANLVVMDCRHLRRCCESARRLPHREAVYGATLATDAVELLAGRTPTTSLEAMALKHQFEVLAECQFVGTSQHMDVKRRKDDIQRDVSALSDWFGTSRRQKNTASWNAGLAILNKLIKVFQDNNQYDEEQALMVRARQLHRKLQFAKFWLPVRILQVFPWYVEKLVASFPLFLACIAFWILVLGSCFAWLGLVPWHRGVADAYATFLSIQPPDDSTIWKVDDGWNWGFTLIALTLGLGSLAGCVLNFEPDNKRFRRCT